MQILTRGLALNGLPISLLTSVNVLLVVSMAMTRMVEGKLNSLSGLL